MDCSPPVSAVHGILQARRLEGVALPFSKGSSWPRDQTWISYILGRFFIIWYTKKPILYKANQTHLLARFGIFSFSSLILSDQFTCVMRGRGWWCSLTGFLAIWLSLGNGPGECIRNLLGWGASPQERTWPKARRNLFWYSQFSDKISGSALMWDSPYWTVTPVRARAVSFVYTVQSELSGAWHEVDSKCWLTDWLTAFLLLSTACHSSRFSHQPWSVPIWIHETVCKQRKNHITENSTRHGSPDTLPWCSLKEITKKQEGGFPRGSWG